MADHPAPHRRPRRQPLLIVELEMDPAVDPALPRLLRGLQEAGERAPHPRQGIRRTTEVNVIAEQFGQHHAGGGANTITATMRDAKASRITTHTMSPPSANQLPLASDFAAPAPVAW